MKEIITIIIVIVITKILFEISNVAGGVFLGIVVATGVIYFFIKPRDDFDAP